MRILIFDTETTGLPNKNETDINKQPRIVQFAWLIWHIDSNWVWNQEKKINYLINPWIDIPAQTSEIHWIRNIDVKDKPKFIDLAEEIITDINTVDYIVAHNLKFDEQMIKIEVQRLQMKWVSIDYMPRWKICTMVTTTPICKLPKKTWFWYKPPKLMEAFFFFYKKYFKWAHDAMVDVKVCGLVLQQMIKMKLITLEQIENNQTQLC